MDNTIAKFLTIIADIAVALTRIAVAQERIAVASEKRADTLAVVYPEQSKAAAEVKVEPAAEVKAEPVAEKPVKAKVEKPVKAKVEKPAAEVKAEPAAEVKAEPAAEAEDALFASGAEEGLEAEPAPTAESVQKLAAQVVAHGYRKEAIAALKEAAVPNLMSDTLKKEPALIGKAHGVLKAFLDLPKKAA